MAIFDYNIAGKEPEIKSNAASVAFEAIRLYMDENNKKYEKHCKTNRRDGQKGGAPLGNSNAKKKDSEFMDAPDVEQRDEYLNEQLNVCKRIVNRFNEICGADYEPVDRLSMSRIAGICQMLDSIKQKFPDEKRGILVCQIFEKMQKSDFLSGRRQDSKWRASFNWVIKEENWLKILEGDYD